MIASRRVIRRPILGGFETIHMQGLEYGEIAPFFIEDFADELNENWELIDANGTSTFVTYNEDVCRPLLTTGWNNIREIYNLIGDKQIILNYLGRSRFFFMIGNTIEDTQEIPSFHSRSTKDGRTVFFDITLNYLQMAIPSELILPPTFHQFLRDNDFYYLILWGNDDQRISCDIMYSNYQSMNTKLRVDWKAFCVENNFKLNDKIRFKFFDLNLSNMVHVYQINP